MQVSELVRIAITAPTMIHEDCFVRNKEAELLRETQTDILPIIEHVVLADVMPHCQSSLDCDEKFQGLGHVLVIYFQASNPDELDRAARFLALLSGPVLTTALHALQGFWSGPDEHPLPSQFLPQVELLARQGTQEQEAAAIILLKRHSDYLNLIASGKTPRVRPSTGVAQRGRPVRKKWDAPN